MRKIIDEPAQRLDLRLAASHVKCGGQPLGGVILRGGTLVSGVKVLKMMYTGKPRVVNSSKGRKVNHR